MATQPINNIVGSMNVSADYVPTEIKNSYFTRFLNYILTAWTYFSNLGVKEGQKPSDVKKIKLTNQIAFFGLLTCLLELPIYIHLELMVSVVSILIVNVFMACVLILSRYSFYSQAKTLLFFIVDLILIYATGYMGKESGIYLYFFGLMILPFILFNQNEKIKIGFFILLTLISVFITQFVDLSFFADGSITPAIQKIVFLSSLPMAFITITLNVYLLVKENTISESKLGESETLFKGLLDATPDSTIITDKAGFITLCNKQVETTFGYSTDELLGKHISVLIPLRLKNEASRYFIAQKKQSKKTGNGSDYLSVAKKDGSEVAVDLSQNTYSAKSGTMMIHVIRDMTERNKHEQELIQFSYVVSHDLKAPLRAIFKLSEWIEEELGPGVSGNLKKNLSFLRGRVFRLEALINGLLEYAKIGRTNAKKEKVNSYDLVDEVIELLAPPSNISFTIQAEMPIFETAKTPFQQVFFNLLSNAIKYNDKKIGIINITSKEHKKFYEFSVEDNGIGIDPLYHEKVFVIFQTLEARDKVEGTGIGLAILKKSVEDMGGTVTLQSELGKGSKFTFTWPKS